MSMDTRQSKIQSLSFYMAACICFAAVLFFFPKTIQPVEIQLQSRVNPNSACAASLMRLPNIGISRANVIIEYRSKYTENSTAFKTSQDLDKIKGIGPKTVEKLEQYLIFMQDVNGTVGNQ